MSNVFQYDEFFVKKILKKRNPVDILSLTEKRILSEWLRKKEVLDDFLMKDIFIKRDNKEVLSEVENMILKEHSIRRSKLIADNLDW